MSIEQVLERIAVALERHQPGAPTQQEEQPPQPEQQPTQPEQQPKEEEESPKNIRITTDSPQNRDRIKKELTALGVKYSQKARTYNLQHLLHNAKKDAETAAPVTPEPEAKADAEPAETAQTAENVPTEAHLKETLMSFVRLHGKDRAVEILRKFGAQKLSDIAQKDRGEFLRQLS